MWKKRCRGVWPVFALGVMLAASGGLYAQELEKTIRLDDGDNVPDYPFGLKLSSDGTRLYATVAGDIYTNNQRVVEIDTATDTVVLEGQTGLFPEEIEIRYSVGGGIEKIFVSNSSDGTVSVLNPDLTFSNLVDLGLYGAGWPYGLCMGPHGRFLFVCTQNFREVFQIDTEPGAGFLNVTTHSVSVEFNARMAIDGGRLVIAGTDLEDGAALTVVDLANPSQVESVVLQGHQGGWASANDVSVVDGLAYVPVLDYSGINLLYEVDVRQSPPAVTRTIDITGPYSTNYEHGIGASPDGNTLVVTTFGGPAMIVGRKVGCLLTFVDLADFGAGEGNEVLFSLNGDKAYFTDQKDDNIYVITGIPKHGLHLTGPDSAPLGGLAEFTLKGGEAGASGALLASLNLGPIVFPRFTLDLGSPVFRLAERPFDGENALPGLTWVIPNWPVLSGKTIYLQGLARDGDGEIRPSNLHEVLVL